MPLQEVYHTYDYFDFLPRIPDTVSFNPSLMLPGGLDCKPIPELMCQTDMQRAVSQSTIAAMTRGPATELVQVEVEKATCPVSNFVSTKKSSAAVAATSALRVCIVCLPLLHFFWIEAFLAIFHACSALSVMDGHGATAGDAVCGASQHVDCN